MNCCKPGAMEGTWLDSVSPEGNDTHLTAEEARALYVRTRDADRSNATHTEENVLAPSILGENDQAAASYWFVGTVWNKADQMHRFLAQGCWENGCKDKLLDLVRRMKPGDRIAMKTSFVQRRRLPFEAGEKPVSVMRIKATGMILENPGDGRKVKVAWDPSFEVRDWYFYTYRTTIVKADTEGEYGRRLIDFTFRGVPQDYVWWLSQPYWSEKYKTGQEGAFAPYLTELPEVDLYEDAEEEQSYSIEDIVEEGCFLTRQELRDIYRCWDSKKNLILQGPPGTGKTWLAKRLGFVRVGSKDREITRSRLRVIQFHPSLTYEDFVRGWRPNGDGRLSLVDGILMQAIEAAVSEPDNPFVLVIEEINRGNPAQIFGEMLTLLENTKRGPSETIELAYRKDAYERIHIPENLFLIGTMNVADLAPHGVRGV
jgi:5-methylcytosine-specific restriction protein B